jgi:20S proteasome alpha/beta subunit
VTSIVGVLCSEGAVIGTDSAATFGPGPSSFTIEQPTQKIDVIESVIVAGTGTTGMNQRFCQVIDQAYKGTSQAVLSPPDRSGRPGNPIKLFTQESPVEIGKALSRAMIADMAYTYMKPGGYGALVAFPCRNAPHLCEFQVADFQPDLKNSRLWYVSIGSAQPITDPFLGFIRDVFWNKGQPSVKDAIFAATWTLQHAIELNTGGVKGPIQIAVLEKGAQGKYGARVLDPSELDEHQQHIQDARSALRDFRWSQKPEQTASVPDVPRLGDK